MNLIRDLSLKFVFPIILVVIFLGNSAFCQVNGPAPTIAEAAPQVAASFHSIFPNATITRVDTVVRNGARYYKIEIIDDAEKRIAVFSDGGMIEEVVDSIAFAALPAHVKGAVARNYPLAKVVETYKKTTDAGFEYIVKISSNKDLIQLNFTTTSMSITSKGVIKKGRVEKSGGLAQQ